MHFPPKVVAETLAVFRSREHGLKFIVAAIPESWLSDELILGGLAGSFETEWMLLFQNCLLLSRETSLLGMVWG